MLLQILQLFEERKTISLNDLSLHFKIDRSAMQEMLKELVQKGKLSKLHLECNSCSSGCEGCSFADEMDVYTINS